MKILILGAGQVGSNAANILSQEAKHEVTIVDVDSNILANLQERYDIRTVVGNASLPHVLDEAGAKEADIVIAVTSSDEVNMIACQLSHTLFDVRLKIARIRSQSYIEYADIFGHELEKAFNIDVIISPEILVKERLKNIINLPGAQQVLRFDRGRVLIVAAQAEEGGRLVGLPIKDLPSHLPDIDVRIVAIFRKDEPLEITGESVIEVGDEVYYLCPQKHARLVMAEIRPSTKIAKKVMIAGGGNIGYRLASALEDDLRVKIIEIDKANAARLTSHLKNALVLNGDCTDEALLYDENIDQIDVYCAVTEDEQTNILSSMLAKRLGAKRVITLINRSAFVDLVENESNIDIAFSPQQVTLGVLLTYIRKGDVIQLYSLGTGDLEAFEIVAHGTPETSRIIGKVVEEIDWPDGITLAGIIRNQQVIVSHKNSIIEENDHMIFFISNKQSIPELESLCQIKGSHD
ncbi:Trk system potassium transporter TrkA [Wohlfahrtiimonas chitiniclastica]|uniref:Trk system potassium transporter TrkA n=1 Tax=Wohlfahrtiimonas chitiniclastica TaxID=400946 RepID=UPI0003450A2E|nr:Trk system potassium transporter TrkA [Wohlfahrtiimonas chitiniclastica]KZS22403.1 potassium transporter peripheral membrane component [Wohlfahrtiimonas chitiniclastica]MBS7813999.1 Trk system potassium transporter TrkA [Wohlfahrtiimonas chitiniclastica]MBS7816262.1 Trk system potassium transporter TrkA [Wohlfahrtiimonas chitiniclastica]MBS7817895.1 Trk system potassium transporter TrkA [Wohlfahrtiimonas chitiniclastica]MBS7819794.1 Trk system potassium transporter TrkA [Wohlfahrtiimonas ch